MIGHVAPEAALGGPIALVEEGDQIVIDVEARRMDLNVPEAVLAVAARGMARTGAALSRRRDGQVRRPRLVGERRRGHHRTAHGRRGISGDRRGSGRGRAGAIADHWRLMLEIRPRHLRPGTCAYRPDCLHGHARLPDVASARCAGRTTPIRAGGDSSPGSTVNRLVRVASGGCTSTRRSTRACGRAWSCCRSTGVAGSAAPCWRPSPRRLRRPARGWSLVV